MINLIFILAVFLTAMTVIDTIFMVDSKIVDSIDYAFVGGYGALWLTGCMTVISLASSLTL